MNPTIAKIIDSIWVGAGVFIGWNLMSFLLGFVPVAIEKLGK